MTNLELSNEFDVLYDNITSNKAPGLDEYEKSVFLTKAQDEIIKSYFNPKLNKSQEGFDGNERRPIDFSMITRVRSFTNFYDKEFDSHNNTKTVLLDEDIMIFVNEFADVTRDGNEADSVRLTVVPIDYNNYSKLMSKPYTRPLKYQAWRLLFNGKDTREKRVEIVIGPDDILKKYTIRYIIKPYPILLVSLTEDDFSIGGGYVGTDVSGNPTKDINKVDKNIQGIECKLDSILHPEILQRAVELAKAAYEGNLQSQIMLGQVSQTNMGMITQS